MTHAVRIVVLPLSVRLTVPDSTIGLPHEIEADLVC